MLKMTGAGASLLLFALVPVRGATGPELQAIEYGQDGSYALTERYREWVFLSSGVDMVYGPKAAAAPSGHSQFDNVFVNPAAYRSFLKTGTWPERTVMVLEVRGAETNASINRGGHSQSVERTGLEVHLKDSARYAGGWAFFDVDASGKGKLIAQPASCYTCHQEHAAVNTTFVQFYPTLLPIAKEHGTLSAAYLKELKAAPAQR